MPELAAADDGSAAGSLADALEALIPDVGLEGRLRDFGVEEHHLPELTDGALRQERLIGYNAKPMTRDDVEAVFREAF